jgi:hypothetical protein
MIPASKSRSTAHISPRSSAATQPSLLDPQTHSPPPPRRPLISLPSGADVPPPCLPRPLQCRPVFPSLSPTSDPFDLPTLPSPRIRTRSTAAVEYSPMREAPLLRSHGGTAGLFAGARMRRCARLHGASMPASRAWQAVWCGRLYSG